MHENGPLPKGSEALTAYYTAALVTVLPQDVVGITYLLLNGASGISGCR